MTASLVIVGELNPFGGDPYFALYHLPRESSGNRLRKIMGLADHVYERLAKVNLCTGTWSIVDARRKAEQMQSGGRRLVLLGTKVRAAFLGPEPFAREQREGAMLLGLPHPSGLNRAWTEVGARERALVALRDFAPEIEWGAS